MGKDLLLQHRLIDVVSNADFEKYAQFEWKSIFERGGGGFSTWDG